MSNSSSRGELNQYMQKCLDIQKKMFELGKEGRLTIEVYTSLLNTDRFYGSLIKKERLEAENTQTNK